MVGSRPTGTDRCSHGHRCQRQSPQTRLVSRLLFSHFTTYLVLPSQYTRCFIKRTLFCFFCLSNAMHSIGQSIKSPEYLCVRPSVRPSVRPTFHKLFSFHFPFPYPFPFFFSFHFSLPFPFSFPFTFPLFYFFPFPFSFLFPSIPLSLPFFFLFLRLSFPVHARP